MKRLVWLYLLLPLLLWPISFILLRQYFAYAMLASSFLLALLTVLAYKKVVFVKGRGLLLPVVLGIVGAIALYLLFWVGGLSLYSLGFYSGIVAIYSMIGSQGGGWVLAVGLAFIAIFEEIYWRYGLMRLFGEMDGRLARFSWLVAAFYYGAVHLLTLNFILAGAALFVGLVTAWIANKKGVLASIITHIVWIELIVVLFPIRF
jgi:hypothetical protein